MLLLVVVVVHAHVRGEGRVVHFAEGRQVELLRHLGRRGRVSAAEGRGAALRGATARAAARELPKHERKNNNEMGNLKHNYLGPGVPSEKNKRAMFCINFIYSQSGWQSTGTRSNHHWRSICEYRTRKHCRAQICKGGGVL